MKEYHAKTNNNNFKIHVEINNVSRTNSVIFSNNLKMAVQRLAHKLNYSQIKTLRN